ncbi:hypothetical protein EQG49_12860 [Periweissella cryptocerci]|uniref:Uncharacterized protein n=1 Tax=Periweissella cryptocerci TaxID=2506420 RepID=A0A4P6YWW9_9LACO|nr:hypothetical protein [Periweissella cryptocerci]QBO37287.1 hypothetical protein EQG49_12860 [Periweissella cryptocerci]
MAEDEFAKLIKEQKRAVAVRLHAHLICRVTSIDGNRCDLQPLALSGRNKRSLIPGALILKHVREDLKVGDDVWVGFHDNNIDNYVEGSGETFKLASSRLHNINDAVVEGVIT